MLPTLPPNTMLQNRYRIVQLLKAGGMGEVYEAFDERLSSQVALKRLTILNPNSAVLQAFKREAKLLANLRHPALPRVSDHFEEQQSQFLVMEFVAGPDLDDILQAQNKPFSINVVLRWADQLLDALDYLHSQNPPILHRDIKPQNLKVTDRGQIMLLDFGIAKGSVGLAATASNLSIFGYTPGYAPLEQMQSVGTSERSDLYALGATLYHLITNVTPPDALARASNQIYGQPDSLQPAHVVNPAVPLVISNVLIDSLALNINQRPASAAAMRQALQHIPTIATPVANPPAPSSAGQPTIRVVSPAIAISADPPTIPIRQPATRSIITPNNAQKMVNLETLTGHSDGVLSVGWSSNEINIASASLDGTVRLWNVNGSFHNQLSTKGVTSIAWSPDGKILASTSRDRTVRLWSADGSGRAILVGHTDSVTSVAWSPDGTMLASASLDRTVRLWNTDGSVRTQFAGHTDRVTSVAWSPDGTTIASASFDNTIRLWNTNGSFRNPFKGHSSNIYSVAWNPDGTMLASASRDRTVGLWDIYGSFINQFVGHTDDVWAIAWSPASVTTVLTHTDPSLWQRYERGYDDS